MNGEIEYRDLYDENRRPLGRSVPANTRLQPDEYMVAVGMWIINSRGEILITRRSPEKRYAPNLWENPAGHRQAGEDSLQAVLREVEEETGVRVAAEQVRFLGSAQSWPYFGDNYCVRMDVPLSAIRLQPGETCDVKWVTLAQLEDMAKNGELAPSVWTHMDAYRANFYRIFE